MSSFIYYEPFYHFERLLDDAFNVGLSDNNKQLQRRANRGGQDAGVTALFRPT
ncbi:hypothetical protein C0993_007078, partial [Termitomyces sp. T159_Od127]